MRLSATHPETYVRSRSLFALLLASTANVLAVGMAHAEPTCQDFDVLCSIGTFENGIDSRATAVSANGLVVVGYGEDGIAGEDRAFIWNATDGMLSLGILTNGLSSEATAVNSDGTVVVGIVIDEENEYERAFRWTRALGMQDLGVLDNEDESKASGVSADGSVVVGVSDSANGDRAFRWTLLEGMQSLGVLEGNFKNSATAVSGDGSVVVGVSDFTNNQRRAFRWTTETQIMENLGVLVGGTRSAAKAISSDGNVIVGESNTTSALNDISFRWTQVDGMLALPELEKDRGTFASAVSSDGSVVVGRGNTSGGTRAFRWTEDLGIVNLGVLGVDDGNARSEANGVSADGSVVVGTSEYDNFFDSSNNFVRAFIWRTKMQDFENLMASFPVIAGETELAFGAQQIGVNSLMDSRGLARGAGKSFVSIFGGVSNTGLGDDMGSRNASLGGISYGYGVTDQLTMGFSVSANGTNVSSTGFDLDNGFGAAAWGVYSENGANRTGLQGSFALGYLNQDGAMTRGLGVVDVEAASGTAGIITRSARLELGYGFDYSSGWVLTPAAAITHYSSTRGAYAENPEATAFSAAYDKLETSSTIGTVGMTGGWQLADDRRLSLGAGTDFDLDGDAITLAGSANIPGMETFAVNSPLSRNDIRPYVTASYSMDVANRGTFTASVRAGRAMYGDKPEMGVGLRYAVNF